MSGPNTCTCGRTPVTLPRLAWCEVCDPDAPATEEDNVMSVEDALDAAAELRCDTWREERE